MSNWYVTKPTEMQVSWLLFPGLVLQKKGKLKQDIQNKTKIIVVSLLQDVIQKPKLNMKMAGNALFPKSSG